ncbi:hypothetical protein LCGC14_1979960 [marine sediment metagenome]|uniref:Uncharacterized protein n=1 Tax=marine sediment metagenome TaxID=412755 RepID=A0A0F9HMJ1_9ZZZZ
MPVKETKKFQISFTIASTSTSPKDTDHMHYNEFVSTPKDIDNCIKRILSLLDAFKTERM